MKKKFKVYTPNKSVKFYLMMWGCFVATLTMVCIAGIMHVDKKSETYQSLQEEVKLNNELMRGK